MPIYNFKEMTYQEIESLDRNKTVIIFTASPLEEHGPHLPVGVDAYNGEFFATEISKRIISARLDWNIVILPTLHIGISAFDSPGTILVRQRVIRDLVVDYASSVAKYGFKYIIVSNGHGGVKHVVALEEASNIVSKKYKIQMISPTGGIAFKFLKGKYYREIGKKLGKEFTSQDLNEMSHDSHAGQWETSMMLKNYPHFVKEIYKNLQPIVVEHREKIKKNYALINGRIGYVGYPAKADKEFADASSEVILELAMNMINKMLNGEDIKKESRSPFYRIPFFRTNFRRNLIFASCIIVVTMLYFIFYF